MENPHDDNISRQAEEIEVLKSIYGEEWKEDVSSWSISLAEGSLSLELYVTLTEVYPNEGPPLFQILAPSLSREEMLEITNTLQDLYLDNIGETIIYQWVEKAREWLQERVAIRDCVASFNASNTDVDDDHLDCDADFSESWYTKYSSTGDKSSAVTSDGPKITHGDPISFKKSTFQGHAASVTTTDQVKQVIAILMENKKVANATHNIHAYRIYREGTKSFSQDCDDDGETQAGSRLLHLLQIMDARNVLVVVSRWYGGVHLGPDRFRLINNAARQVLDKAGLLPTQDSKKRQ